MRTIHRPPTVGTRRTSAGVVATMISASLPPFVVGTLSIQIGQDIDFVVADLGLAVATYYLVSALLSPFGGRVVVALGPILALRLTAAGSSVGLAIVGLAGSAPIIILALAFLGIPNSFVQPASNQLLATVEPRHRGLTFGLVQSAIPLSALTGGVLLAIFGDPDRWRWGLGTVVVLTLLTQLVIPTAVRRTSSGRTSLPDAVPSITAPTPRTPAAGPLPGGSWLILGIVTGAFLASVAATTLPSFVATTGEGLNLSSSTIAAAQISGSLGCIAVRILAAWHGGRRSGPAMLTIVVWLLAFGAGGYLLIAWGTPWAFVVGVFVAYTLGWGWNGLFNLSVTHARPGRIAATTGLTQGGVFFGGVCGPLMFTAVSGSYSPSSGWAAIAAIALVSAASIEFARRRWLKTEEGL